MGSSNFRNLQADYITGIASLRNYITNGTALENTAGWVVSKNTVAAARPDSGFVTSATNITFTRTTSSPLSGDASFLITKDAANRQGEQVYIPFTIDSADQAKMMTLSFDYQVASGTFVFSDGKTTDSDVIAYVYDVTNATFIEPIGFRFTNNSNAKMSFQTASNSTSYRLLLHVATTSASAYTLKVDNICLTRQVLASDSLITDWKSYSPSINGATTSGMVFNYSRVGQMLFVEGAVILSTVSASQFRISLPGSLLIDSSVSSTTLVGSMIRDATFSSTFNLLGLGGNSYVTGSYNSGGAFVSDNTSNLFSAGATISVSFQVPIQGWATNTSVLSSGEGRVVAASITHTSNLSVTGGSAIVPTSVLKDTHSAYNTSTGQYTCPVAGIYRVVAGGITSTGQRTLKIYKNGSYHMAIVSVNTSAVLGGEYQVDCKAGDVLTVVPDSSDTLIYSATNYQMYLSFERISGPEQVQAGEIVVASYTPSADQSVPNNTDTKITYNTKSIDTHGAFDTTNNRYIVPASGIYEISGAVTWYMSSSVRNTDMNVQLWKNGSLYKKTYKAFGYSSDVVYTSYEYFVELKAGEYVEIYVNQTSTVTLGTYGDASTPGSNYLNIKKLK